MGWEIGWGEEVSLQYHMLSYITIANGLKVCN